MQVNIHHPTVESVATLSHEAGREFHALYLTDVDSEGRLVVFIRADWSDWDALVATVDKYRAALPNP